MTSRRIDLEERFLFVERELEELSRVVARQGLVIEQLEAEVLELRRTAAPGGQDAGSDSDTARTLEEDRPPHY
jgi:uncharacterized coiled-coil protein SlyX